MKTACLAVMISLTTMILFGCGGGGSSGGGGGSSSGGASSSGGSTGSSSAAGGSSSASGGSSSAGGASSGGGAGSSSVAGGSSGGASSSSSKTESKPLAIEGQWLFLGPTGPGHEITITSKSIKYKGTETDWESNWTIKKYDNDLHQFQLAFDSGHGEAYPSGDNFSATFAADETFLSIQLAKGLDSYPKLDTDTRCTDGLEPIPDCKLYMKMQ